jgi:hypothetical protein
MTDETALAAAAPPVVASDRPEYWTAPLTYIGGLTVGFLAGAVLYMTMRGIAARLKKK